MKAHGAKVTVSDTKSGDDLRNEIPVLLDHGITVETGGHGDRTFRGQDLIVVSPGVPVDAPPLVQARSLGETVIGEIELAAQFLPGPIVAITGSNGKTTTTTLVGEIMTAAGLPALVGGNIGTPAISLADRATERNRDRARNFQLPARNHSDLSSQGRRRAQRHAGPSWTGTARSRSTLTRRLASSKTSRPATSPILNADDPTCVAMGGRTRAQVYWFSRMKEVEQGAWVRDGNIVFRDRAGQREILQVSEIPLKGAHNLENVLAAVCSGVLMGCAPEKIRQAVRDFKAVEHRLEFVATIRGVDYYNDSKATNVDATIKALESFPANIHLILGGKDKGSDYTVLNDLLRQRVKRVYTIGAAAAKIESQIVSSKNGGPEVVHAETLENAIRKANAVAQEGDIVLLAPACASFDQFKSYEHRGKVFKEIVRSLSAEPVK